MRAFLSYSSKDRHFVSSVAALLGDSVAEFDERTFEYILNVEAIRRALKRTDIYVYFLSAASISSPFVNEEARAALEKRGSGEVKRVLIFTLDDTSYTQLPEWLREINVIQRVSSPKICARKIQSALLRLSAEVEADSEIYLGRESEDAALAKALSGSPANTPVAIHAVGHFGVGRKTFVRRNLRTLFPRRFDAFPEIALSANQGIEEFFRQVYELIYNGTITDALRDFQEFARLNARDKVIYSAELVTLLRENGDFLLVVDDGRVYTEAGTYQPYLRDLLDHVQGRGLPVMAFIQTRMMPARIKADNPIGYHQYLSTLSDDNTLRLFGLSLKQLGVNYSDEQVTSVTEVLDGHPFNVRFAAMYSRDYGLETLIADPSDLVEWKRRRAEDFLSRIEFIPSECEIIAAISEYRYLAPETIFAVADANLSDVAKSLRKLQEYSCIEGREGYFQVAPPLRDAIRRDARFQRSEAWKQELGSKICAAIGDYTNEDNVPISLIESATLASVRSPSPPAFLANFVLPSHLLKIARDYYDDRKWGSCIEFCQKTWSSKDRLPGDAQLETLRLWGLSAVRINDRSIFDVVVGHIKLYRGDAASRIYWFLEGFLARNAGNVQRAEECFKKSWNITPNNQSVNRELTVVLCKQRRYDEAEKYARIAHEQAPTNPYSIDAMVEVLLGKKQQGLRISENELGAMMDDLKRYGGKPGASFFRIREAQGYLASRNFAKALDAINQAITLTPDLMNARFIRAEAQLGLVNLSAVERDIVEIERMLQRAGGSSEGDEGRLDELRARIYMENGEFARSREFIQSSRRFSESLRNKMLDHLARLIAFKPNLAGVELKEWATKRQTS